MSEHWNTAATVTVVSEACQELGVDMVAITTAAGIDPSVLTDPDGRVTLEQMGRFWQLSIEQSGDPALGLHAGQVGPSGVYRTMEFLGIYSASVGAGLSRFAEYFPLINSWLRLHTTDDATGGCLWIDTVYGAPPRPAAEYTVSTVLRRTRSAWGLGWRPTAVRFEFPKSADVAADEYAAVLDCEVEFGAPRTEVVLDRATWDTPVATADEALVTVLEEHAARLRNRLPGGSGLVQSVRDAVAASLPGGDAGLEVVASKLGFTGRTLQRRLADDGLAFADMADMVRHEAAKLRLAERQLSIAEVAYMVGFAEQSSFTRAFKRWTGMSPQAYRLSQAASA